MRELDDEIREIKKEIIESRGLAIKTNNLTSALAADVKGIAKRQLSYERRLLWNGGVAYALFALLSFLGLKLASDARLESLSSEQAGLRGEVEHLRSELAVQTRRDEQRRAAAQRASEFHEWIRAGKRREVLRDYEGVRALPLSTVESAVFAEAVARFRVDLAVSTYQQGLERLRAGRPAEAVESFRSALELSDAGAHVLAARYYQAVALRQLRRCEDALPLLNLVIAGNDGRDLQDDALMLAGGCHVEAGRFEQAREAWQTLLRRFPRTELLAEVRVAQRDSWLAQARARRTAAGAGPQPGRAAAP